MAKESKNFSSVSTESTIYSNLKNKWEKVDIVYQGEEEVQDSGVMFMPKLEIEEPDEYNFFVQLTRFINAFKKTIKGLKGTVNKKQHNYDFSDIDEKQQKDIDLKGTTILEYFDIILEEVIKKGVCGTLVDYNSNIMENGEISKRKAELLNLRPKFSFYQSDCIINHQYSVVNGIKQLSLLVLLEEYNLSDDKFIYKPNEQYRVCELTLNDANGNYEYTQTIYRIGKDGNEEISDPLFIKMNGKIMDFIPFIIHGSFENPPLYDLLLMNIKLYQLQNTLARLLWYVGCPTPYRTGVDPKDNNLPNTLGGGRIWDLENENSKVGLLEISGAGAGAIQIELKNIKEDMAYLGAKMLMTDSIQNETATKTIYRNSSETASLSEIVDTLSDSLTKLISIFVLWAKNKETKNFFEFNKDFDITKLTAQEILARVTSWQSGAFSKRSLFKQLKEGEVEMEKETFEEEQELINKGE